MSQPFVWGERDCALWACSWVAEARGIDPAAKWRGVCNDGRHAARIIAEAGSLLAICREAFGAAGLQETDAPEPGDIGVIDTPVGQAVVIRTKRGWAWKSEKGLTVVPSPYLAAWKVV